MENTTHQNSEGTAVVRVLATVLECLVKANTNLLPLGPAQVTKFHALKAPGISILQYLERIHKYASCSTECFILALIYIDRLIQRHNFVLNELNVHRVVLTSILLAAKFFDDAYYNNAYYAKVGGVLVSEINGLEVEFLFRLNFSLHVKPDEFAKYQAKLVSHAVGPEIIPAPVITPNQILPNVHPSHLEQFSHENSQPPSPQAMSSQSTSPSMSPTNDSCSQGAYQCNHNLEKCSESSQPINECALERRDNIHSAKSFCSRDTAPDTSLNQNTTTLPGNHIRVTPTSSNIPVDIHFQTSSHVNVNPCIQQNNTTFSQPQIPMTSRDNQSILPSTHTQMVNFPYVTQNQIIPSCSQGHQPTGAPQQLGSHTNLNMYVQHNDLPVSTEIRILHKETYNSLPLNETRLPSLSRYNSFPYGIQSKPAKNFDGGNYGTYPLQGTITTQQKQMFHFQSTKDALYSRCAHYRKMSDPIAQCS